MKSVIPAVEEEDIRGYERAARQAVQQFLRIDRGRPCSNLLVSDGILGKRVGIALDTCRVAPIGSKRHDLVIAGQENIVLRRATRQ